MATVRPSTQPSSRSRCTKTAVQWLQAEGVLALRSPTVGSLLACCARQAARPDSPGIDAATRRRGDRIAMWFAALHMSAFGTKRTWRDVFYLSAFGGKADISQQLPDSCDFMSTRPSVAVQKSASLLAASPKCGPLNQSHTRSMSC